MANGPTAAVDVLAQAAPEIAASLLSKEYGWKWVALGPRRTLPGQSDCL